MVEQLLCKHQVVGPNPTAGSNRLFIGGFFVDALIYEIHSNLRGFRKSLIGTRGGRVSANCS